MLLLVGWPALVCAASPQVRAAPAAEATDVDVLDVARRALAGELSRAELRRLLRHAEVGAALRDLLQGWDGEHDTLEVRRRGRELELRAVTRDRRRHCVTPAATAEQAEPQPICYEEVEPTGERSLVLARALWRAPKAAPPPPEPTPPPSEPELPAEVAPSVLRGPAALKVTDLHVEADAERGRLAADYADFRGRVGTTSWRDPFRAGGLDTPAELIDEAHPPPVLRELPSSNAEAQLANPFSDHRLGPQLQIPQHPAHTYRHDAPPVEALVIDSPDFACLRAWRAGGAHQTPPRLACFMAALKTARLGRGPYEAASWLATLLPSPFSLIAGEVAASEYARARDETASALLWAATWLAWIDTHRPRLREAVRGLTAAERRALRRRLYRWWGKDEYAPVEAAITRLYEEHLGDLYPALRDADGLPRRRLFDSDFLWGTNWLAAQLEVADVRVQQRFDSLGAEERAILRALARDPRLRRRFERVAAVIAPHR